MALGPMNCQKAMEGRSSEADTRRNDSLGYRSFTWTDRHQAGIRTRRGKTVHGCCRKLHSPLYDGFAFYPAQNLTAEEIVNLALNGEGGEFNGTNLTVRSVDSIQKSNSILVSVRVD